MKRFILSLVSLFIIMSMKSQELTTFSSPNGVISVTMQQNTTQTFMKVKKSSVSMATVYLGVATNVENFSNKLSFVSASEPTLVTEEYDNIHGKFSHVISLYNEVVAHFKNANETTNFDIVVRAYDTGVTFKYVIPDEDGVTRKFTNEATTYQIAANAHRWLQQFSTSYEGDFGYESKEGTTGSWGFPALFEYMNTFMLLTEANVSKMYSSTHLSNTSTASKYKVDYPFAWEGNNSIDVNPQWTGAWTSPWRVMIIGKLQDIVESTLVEDVSEPCKVKQTSWIKPGSAAWVYWAYNHGTRDYQICRLCVSRCRPCVPSTSCSCGRATL